MSSLKDFDYEDIKVIGRGQYGKAHLVRRGIDQGTFIAKTIDLTCLSSKEREGALQEVALLRRLDHPNIVAYKDNFFMGDTLVIIMEYCEGGDLSAYIKDMLKQKMRIREVQIMNYFVQVLQALQYIHRERILHRDLKTSNLFLMHSKKVVKLGDFGISRVLEGTVEAAMTVVGTPYYMSPEVCENKPYTYKSDVWSLGCVLYELCVLKHAFSADNLLGLVYKIVSDKYEPIPKMYSHNLNTLVQSMLEKNADKRPSVRELLADTYVHSFMNEYVRTRGQCASTDSLRSVVVGSAGSAPSIASDARGSDARGPGVAAGVPGQAAADGKKHGLRRPARPACGAAKKPPSDAGGGSKNETPKEAALRRKREAADRQAAELKLAAKQSLQNKTVARKMKEAEFQTTKFGAAMPAFAQCPVSPDSTTMNSVAPSAADDYDDGDSASLTPDEELLEEIDEDDFSDSEEYDDDFEDDFYTDDDIVEEDSDLEVYAATGGAGVLSTVREEQDFTRVMSNYEQDLARAKTGASPLPGRFNENRVATAQAPVATSSSAPAQPARMDIQSRADRMRQDLVRKLGADTFEKAFAIIYESRSRNTPLDRRSLEALVGRENYKTYCFEIDQLVFQKQLYS